VSVHVCVCVCVCVWEGRLSVFFFFVGVGDGGGLILSQGMYVVLCLKARRRHVCMYGLFIRGAAVFSHPWTMGHTRSYTHTHTQHTPKPKA
jgi:hypothetical protein